jgi:hypothetical protein
MPLYDLHGHPEPVAPTLVAAMDGWVDAGSSATAAAAELIRAGERIVTFDPDALFDYRSRRPTLEIEDGRLARLTWPELTIHQVRIDEQDLLVLSGAEPDDRWRQLTDELVDLARQLGVTHWISIGAIPAAVPHTRPVPILGTESAPGILRGGVTAGPEGTLKVPSALISVLEKTVGDAGIPAVGYFAQIPHYVSGPYPAASIELLRTVGRHLDTVLPEGLLGDEARALRNRLDAAAAVDENTRAYVARLESMVDESRLPSGADLIGEIERFLRDRGSEMGGGGRPN